jgi:EAL domain-containing protein (putative c-di-GMP-specific phosphodiesterase class I)
VVAEGIELPEQASSLEALGCEIGQGFLFAKPMPAAALDEFLGIADTAARPRADRGSSAASHAA